MGSRPGPHYATGELVTVHLGGAGQREATWRAGSVLAWCEVDGQVWVTVQWYDLETLGFCADLFPESHCRKVTPRGLRRVAPS
jgi:hypothetical protein